jgi:hypothetical protein
MENSYKTEFGKRFDILEQSKEMEIYRNFQALQASFRVFSGNFHELVRGLEHLKDSRSSLAMYNDDHRENVHNLLDQTSRLFHNFLASAFSLIEHTRKIVNRLYSGQAFKDEYQKKLEQDVISQPVHGFVKELRNYTQHYTLPILALQITFLENLDFRVKMDVEILKQWDNWKSSKSYLDTLGESFCIETVANEYFVLIQNFYVWLTQRQLSVHQADFAKLQQMQQDLTA